jgi:DNA (cytosine-5)-methyltransferase 1
MHTVVESLPAVSLCLNAGAMGRQDSETETLIPMRRGGFFDGAIPMINMQGSKGMAVAQEDGPSYSLNAMHGHDVHAIAVPIAFHPTQDPISSTDGSTHARGCGSSGGQASCAVAFKPSHFTRGKDGEPSETFPPLSADADKGDQEPVIFQTRIARNGRGAPDTICPALNGTDAGETSDMRPVLKTGMAVRRLTPTECERLMGWPDGHTAGFSDSTRYKMCGNGIVASCSAWIAKRIVRFSAAQQ